MRKSSGGLQSSTSPSSISEATGEAARHSKEGSLMLARLHQLRGLGDPKVLKSLGRSSKGRHYRG